MGFFSDREKQRSKTVGEIPRCGACKLNRGCRSPNMEVVGEGRRRLMVVGEAPGQEEDRRGRPFIGQAGQLLQKQLKRAGVNLFRDCWVTNAVTCRPPDNRDPLPAELEGCLPNLAAAIRERQPEAVLLLGKYAVEQVVGMLWDGGIGTLGRWAGWTIPSVRHNAWLCSTYHPSYIGRKKGDEVELLIWQEHLQQFADLEGKPWPDGPPDYDAMVRRVYEPEAVVDWLGRLRDRKVPLAFDYECDRLKPDHPDARIVSCAVSDGDVSVSYPWVGAAVESTRDLLWSKTPMIGWNVKFEERWTRMMFGRGVRNWLHDGMLAAHVLDNRKYITSLKFQALIRLGMGSYDSRVSPYLKADSSNGRNRIKQLDLGDLLQYGGLDALATCIIGRQQIKEMIR